jgi:peptidylprolyl isomerase
MMLAACQGDEVESAAKPKPVPIAAPVARRIDQVAPPLDVKEPPADATKTASGLVYKTLVTNAAGAQPKGNEIVFVHYTGWRQSTGATFFTTKGHSQPIAIDVSHAAPGLAEALRLLHKGEKAMLWVPPTVGTPERVVYEVEVVDIASPPTLARHVPLAAPTAGALAPR